MRNFKLKIHQKPFGGKAPPGPAGKRSPRPSSRNMGPTSKGRGGDGKGGERREGRKWKGMEGMGGKEKGKDGREE